MPTNRELLRARKRERGIPIEEVEPTGPIRSARGARTAGGRGGAGTGIEARAAQEVLEEGTAIEGIKDVRTPFFVDRPAQAETGGASVTGIAPTTKKATTLGEFRAGLPEGGTVSAVNKAVGSRQGTGGFVFHEPSKATPQGPAFEAGLPTDRLPTFNELGGAIGNIFKFIGDTSKFNRARGLTPGIPVSRRSPTAETGLAKAKISSLTKQLETASITGNEELTARLQQQLDALIQGKDAGAFEEEAADKEAILNT